jgi:hypothetical protein
MNVRCRGPYPKHRIYGRRKSEVVESAFPELSSKKVKVCPDIKLSSILVIGIVLMIDAKRVVVGRRVDLPEFTIRLISNNRVMRGSTRQRVCLFFLS